MKTKPTSPSLARTPGKHAFGAAALAAILLASALHARTWTNADGTKTFEGELQACQWDAGKHHDDDADGAKRILADLDQQRQPALVPWPCVAPAPARETK